MQLSKRLKAVASLVTPSHAVADVGCDHGYIPIYLIQEGIAQKAIAMDVNVGPLEVAKENIEAHQCSAGIETRLSDGVNALAPHEVKTVVIAGMGGNLVMKILAEGQATLTTVRELILQPQSEIAEVRKFLQAKGYSIVAEDMICEDGKYYPMMKVKLGEMNLTREIDFIYGAFLLKEKNPILKQFLEKEKETLGKISKQISEAGSMTARQDEIEQEMCLNQSALDEYEQ